MQRHFKMYKPYKVLTQFVFTHRKRRNRTLLGDVHADFPRATMAIGRLDEDTEGLLLLTTDGKVSERLRRRAVEKEYWVQVAGTITGEAIDALERGVEISLPLSERIRGTDPVVYTTLPCKACKLETASVIVGTGQSNHPKATTTKSTARKFNGPCNRCGEPGHKAQECPRNPKNLSSVTTESDGKPLRMSLPPGIPIPPSYSSAMVDQSRHGPTSWLSLTINEGKNRQVRRMTAAVGHPTLRLVRVRIGSIALDGMVAGEVRVIEQADMMQ